MRLNNFVLKSTIIFCFCGLRLLSFAQRLNMIDVGTEIERSGYSINLSEFVERITYIALETSNEILVDKSATIFVSDNEIIVRSISNCFVFVRSTGKFQRKIGAKGRGPGEFLSTRGFIDPNKKAIFMMGSNGDLLKYSFHGEFEKRIFIPQYSQDIFSPSTPTNYTWIDQNIACYFSNMVGPEKKLIEIFDESGVALKVYPNRNYSSFKRKMSISLNESQFYHYKKNLYFKEDYSDTVFHVTDNKLVPKMVLLTDKFKKPYDWKWNQTNNSKKHIEFRNFIETDSFLLFKCHLKNEVFQAVFDKSNTKLKVANISQNIINDLDGFLPFSPQTLSTDDFLIELVDAYVVYNWFMKNSKNIELLPAQIRKLANVKETDNPIVVIAKLRK